VSPVVPGGGVSLIGEGGYSKDGFKQEGNAFVLDAPPLPVVSAESSDAREPRSVTIPVWAPIFSAVRKTILLYGLLGGVLIAGLKLIEYRFLVVEHSIEIYGGLVALLFATLGIWLGLKLTKTEERVVVKEVPVHVVVSASEPFVADVASRERLGITPRELEILEQIAAGLSNREIAEKLFVSENTVKTHSSRLFDKLQAKRRTQAVQIAKDARLIP
jgi:DNA-binding CsgD family transcriptional regulator